MSMAVAGAVFLVNEKRVRSLREEMDLLKKNSGELKEMEQQLSRYEQELKTAVQESEVR